MSADSSETKSSLSSTLSSTNTPSDGVTTYEYGTRQSIDNALKEIEEAGETASSLLVTRGHVELEIFLQPNGNLTSTPGMDNTSIGTYPGAPFTREEPSNTNNVSSSPTSDDNIRNITLNSQLELDFTGK